MMRGLIVPICAFLSICFLGKKQYRHHWVAIVLILLGVAFVGAVSIAWQNNHQDEESAVGGSVGLGMVLVLISQFFTGA